MKTQVSTSTKRAPQRRILMTIPAGLAVAIAQTAIDYSKQPPRELQLEAGTSLAIAGFIITFVVLGIFTLLIKATSILAEKAEKAKTPTTAPPTTRVETPTVTKPGEAELVAAAVAAAYTYLSSMQKTISPRYQGGKEDPWVIADRLSPPTLLERGPSLEDLETRRWRESR